MTATFDFILVWGEKFSSMQAQKHPILVIQKKSFLSFQVDRVQNCKIFAPNRASQNPILNAFNETRNESIRSNDTVVAAFYFFLRKYKSRIALVRGPIEFLISLTIYRRRRRKKKLTRLKLPPKFRRRKRTNLPSSCFGRRTPWSSCWLCWLGQSSWQKFVGQRTFLLELYVLNSAEYERESMRGGQEESKKVLFQASEPDSLNKHETQRSFSSWQLSSCKRNRRERREKRGEIARADT